TLPPYSWRAARAAWAAVMLMMVAFTCLLFGGGACRTSATCVDWPLSAAGVPAPSAAAGRATNRPAASAAAQQKSERIVACIVCISGLLWFPNGPRTTPESRLRAESGLNPQGATRKGTMGMTTVQQTGAVVHSQS